MTHRSLDWPPLQQAFAILDSKKRWQEPKTEAAVDVVQATQDGVGASSHLRHERGLNIRLVCQSSEILQLCL